MIEIILSRIVIFLSEESGNVRIKSSDDTLILRNQDIDSISDLIKHNFLVVDNYYKQIFKSRSVDEKDLLDIERISMAIVLFYLYMYNSWRTMYKKQANKDLKFDKKDFTNASTFDIIFSFYKKHYPNDWEQKCSMMMNMSIVELKEYYKKRKDFYTK